jgi:TPR repeat protein
LKSLQGYEAHKYQLGLLLYDGKFMARDEVNAAKWTCLAAEGGYTEAKHLWKEMELFLTTEQLAEAKKRAAEFNSRNPERRPSQMSND